MVALAVRGPTVGTTTGTTWASTANAVDGVVGVNNATYATYTNAVASAVGTIEISGFNFASSIGALDTLNSVSVSLRHFENNTGRFASVRFQAFDGGTAIGTATTCTLATAARNDVATVPATLAQVRSSTFKITVTITGAASTQSRIESIDYVDVTADYTPLPPSITQAAYRFYADGTETGATALAAQDTAPTVDVSSGDVNVQLRARLQSTSAVAVPSTDDWQLQWESNASGTWTNLTAAGANLADSYETTVSQTGMNFNVVSLGQSFLGNGQRLLTISFLLNKTASPTATLTGYLYAHSGTYGTSSAPTGSPLATSTNTIDAASLTTTPTWTSFNFDATLTLTNGTPYIAVVTSSIGSDSTNYVGVGNDNVTLAHAGNRCHYVSPSWTASSGQDLSFRVYTEARPAIVPYDSPNLTDGAATTNRLTGGSGSFVAGEVSETGLASDLGWSANNFTELLYSLTLKQADLANSDTLRFRVLRGTAPALADSYPQSNRDANFAFDVGTRIAETFLGNGQYLTRARFMLNKSSNPDGTMQAALYATTGTLGSTDLPTGTALATSTTTLNNASLTTTPTWYAFDFDGPFLTNGTVYAIGLVSSQTTASPSRPQIGADASSPTHAGRGVAYNSGAWGSLGADVIFEVYTAPSPPLTISQVPTINVLKGAPTTTGRPKVYGGSSFASKPLKVWSGSAFNEKPVKVWTGSTWKTLT